MAWETGESSTDAQGRNLRWVDDLGDELAVAIAVRSWDEAVGLVEKGKWKREPALGTQTTC